MIRAKDISFSYNGKPLLNMLNLTVGEGELHCIIGPNGAGKSTLLRLIGGLLEPSAGEIALNSVPIRSLSFDERAKTISFVFQENYTGFPFTVYEVVLLGRHPRQDSFLFDSDEDRAIADEMLYLLGIYQFRHRLFRTLSGGEKQRVAIAAALVQKTPIILFDEPTAYTDIRYQTEIYRLIHDITRQQNLTSLVVTHDINLASLYCDRVSVLHDGKITASGKPAEVLTEALLYQTYGLGVKIVRHPLADVPVVIPIREGDNNA
ncbi:MAG: hypothetical protein A2268_10260 [Candidatus Raymondbacteria bacterium RifOxyA12_full_50_37]|uniref:ABC transporter domain-containing protein n=1 Tax=Candidatus Raymondbacteria bacterium RIFOXYD12_FULL_49_13 TaxID=1817890 RepID=A0A1F7FKJ9_UNCRA|nr:MAG: hypothetical protein A2268_10260 [Candidatus Raymondbacteria bacterium RifOxyA12_full_50_37]OGJ90148.1 MAG: hypothetical protein A2248_16740 [Candidatus Raymondbacteria bacterium RIFOXYA2_FULL_49_16]OGJ97219.1 MAG: hypothetical protein A2453_01230 [Candidatus Raymondbacteria bacterium RIFOXYC2_FULL_50_21]OGK04487.1 MAG: hypothetical protein A2350_15270 [Candidatus Raymondbacteria bacterium RifOxyB12_full_50_8]OGK07148.1 MAG: hypothetical protein A2519_09365 [Candidatus Raymondbacteria b